MTGRITPCLWFDTQAEDAANFYVSLFPDSRIDRVVRAPGDNPSTSAGAVLTVEFTLDGRGYLGLNGGPHYRLTPAFSMSVDCADQAEVDRLWGALIADGGAPSRCGWLTDRFGLSWQIVPRRLPDLMNGPDRARAGRVMRAMMGMVKLDVAALEAA